MLGLGCGFGCCGVVIVVAANVVAVIAAMTTMITTGRLGAMKKIMTIPTCKKKRAIIISSADGWKQDVGNGKDDLEQHEAKLGSGASGILLPKERWR